MLGWLKKIVKKARRFDLSSDYAFNVGITSVFISLFVTLITLYKLLSHRTNLVPALIIAFCVFIIFTPVYSFIMFLGLQYFKKNEDDL